MRPFIISHATDTQRAGARELTPAEFQQVFGGGDASRVDGDPTMGHMLTVDKGGATVLDPIIQDY